MSTNDFGTHPTAAEMQQTIERLRRLVNRQQEALEALDVLWRARLVSEATDRVIAASQDDEPDPDDVMMLDVWKHPDILRRAE